MVQLIVARAMDRLKCRIAGGQLRAGGSAQSHPITYYIMILYFNAERSVQKYFLVLHYTFIQTIRPHDLKTVLKAPRHPFMRQPSYLETVPVERREVCPLCGAIDRKCSHLQKRIRSGCSPCAAHLCTAEPLHFQLPHLARKRCRSDFCIVAPT